MDASEKGGNIAEKIRDRIDRQGPLTFHDYMELVLYDPEVGYYCQNPPPIGEQGDYLTAPEMGPVFGELLGWWFARWWHRQGRPQPAEILEYGSGTGSLAFSLLSFLRSAEPVCHANLRYRFHDISPSMRKALVGRCRGECRPHGPIVAEEPAGWMPPEPGLRLVLANEFLDALPVHWLHRKEGVLREKYVVWGEDSLDMTWGPISRPELLHHHDWLGVPLQEGRDSFVSLRALQWLEGLDCGPAPTCLLVIDYGSSADVLHHPSRANPRPACISRHQVHFDPCRIPGCEDITVDVDFTSLEKKAVGLGWKMEKRISQSRFLLQLVESAGEIFSWSQEDRRQNLKALTHPDFLGECFQVCLLTKNHFP